MEDMKRTFIVEIKYPECDKLVNATDYLQDLIEGDLVGEDTGRWCVNVKEANIYTARMQIALEMAKFISKEAKTINIKDLAARSVEFADALVEELKK